MAALPTLSDNLFQSPLERFESPGRFDLEDRFLSQVCPGVLDDLDQHTFRDVLMEGNDRAKGIFDFIRSLSLSSIPSLAPAWFESSLEIWPFPLGRSAVVGFKGSEFVPKRSEERPAESDEAGRDECLSEHGEPPSM